MYTTTKAVIGTYRRISIGIVISDGPNQGQQKSL